MFSSKSFIVSGLTFRCLIHFEFIFVYSVRECSNLICLYVAAQFSQHHLLKRLSFFHCIFLPPLSKDKVTIYVWVYLWASYPIPLIYISVFVPVTHCLDYCSFVAQSEVREPDFSSSIFLSQDFFGSSGSLCFHTNCAMFCSSSVKNAIGNLIGIALNLQIDLGSIVIFAMLILPIQEHGISLHLLVSSLISFISVL